MRTLIPTVLEEGSPERKQLDAIRRELAENIAERNRVRNAPLTLDETRARIDRYIEQMLERAPAMEFSAFAMAGHPFPHILRGVEEGSVRELVDLPALVLLIGPEAFTDRCMEICRQQATQAPGLPAKARDEKLRSLEAEALELERDEEVEILRLEALGASPLLRREDANWALILDIWAEASAQASSSSGSGSPVTTTAKKDAEALRGAASTTKAKGAA